MENFKLALSQMIQAMIQASVEWDKLPHLDSDSANIGYPFECDFTEVIHDVIAWRDKLQTIGGFQSDRK